MSSPLQNNIVNLQSILNSVNNLPDINGGGVHLPTLSNAGTASDLLAGKQLIDGNGNIIFGTHECETDSGDSVTTKTIVPNTTQYGSYAWTTKETTVQANNYQTKFSLKAETNSYANASVSVNISGHSKMKIVGTFTDTSSGNSAAQLCVGLYDSAYNFITGYYNQYLQNGSSGTINNTYDISNLSGNYYLTVLTSMGNATYSHYTDVIITSLEFS